MPVALATLATERSISPQRMTKVRPTAMMPVTETWVRMFWRLPSVANESLDALKNSTRNSKVANGATLRRRARSQPRPVGLPGRVARVLLMVFIPRGLS